MNELAGIYEYSGKKEDALSLEKFHGCMWAICKREMAKFRG